MAKVPKSLQPILWSKSVGSLDLKNDKVYIINQVLSYGDIRSLQWLFNTFSKKEIANVFLKKPAKIYSASSLNLIKILLFGSREKALNKFLYVENLPRNIRP